jgi:hypothetical protein
MANEYDLMPQKTPQDWDRFINITADNDPFGHLLSSAQLLQVLRPQPPAHHPRFDPALERQHVGGVA